MNDHLETIQRPCPLARRGPQRPRGKRVSGRRPRRCQPRPGGSPRDDVRRSRTSLRPSGRRPDIDSSAARPPIKLYVSTTGCHRATAADPGFL